MKVRYVGPFDAVEIAETGQVVEQNHQVEVTTELGRSLCQQATWEKADSSKREDKDGGSS